jgi:hypothetical protein
MRMKSAGGGSKNDLFDRSTGPQNSFNDLREQEDRKRLLHRGADSGFQDGGFGAQNQTAGLDDGPGNRNNRRSVRGNRNAGRGGRTQNQDSNEQGLYSDQMMVDAPPRNPRNRGRWQR